MSMQKLPALFEGQPIEITVIGGERWVRGPQVGAALGFADPGKAIRKIFSRNGREFSIDDAMVVEIAGQSGGPQLTRLFSATGVAKIAMLANTPRAAAFRDWAARMLVHGPAAETAPKAIPSPDPYAPNVMTELRQCFVKACGARFVRYLAMDLTTAELKKLTGYTAVTIARKRRAAEALGLVEVKSPLLAERRAKAAARLIPGGPRKNPLTLVPA